MAIRNILTQQGQLLTSQHEMQQIVVWVNLGEVETEGLCFQSLALKGPGCNTPSPAENMASASSESVVILWAQRTFQGRKRLLKR